MTRQSVLAEMEKWEFHLDDIEGEEKISKLKQVSITQ